MQKELKVICNEYNKCEYSDRCSHGVIHIFEKGKCDCPDCSALTSNATCIEIDYKSMSDAGIKGAKAGKTLHDKLLEGREK